MVDINEFMLTQRALTDAQARIATLERELAEAREDWTEEAVGALSYRGNTVSYIYDKVLALKASMGRAQDHARIEGRKDRDPELAAAQANSERILKAVQLFTNCKWNGTSMPHPCGLCTQCDLRAAIAKAKDG